MGEGEACGNRGETVTGETEQFLSPPGPLHLTLTLDVTLTLTLIHHLHHPLKVRGEWGRGKIKVDGKERRE
jgi:hypothetical protein